MSRKVSVYKLHKILGHVAQEAVLHAYKKGLIEGIDLDIDSKPQFCDACAQAKATRQPYPAESKMHAHTYGEVIHTDLWGPAQTVSIGGNVYYISFTDDYSRETKIRFLKHKGDALEAFKQHVANLTRQHPEARVCKLRSDRGGEYMSNEFTQYLRDEGIERQLTVHDSPQQNGVAERLNRTLVEHARAMLLARNLPKFLWAEAIGYATWLKNRMPSRATPTLTPHALVYNTPANIARAHEFGCKVYVHQMDAGKLEARAEEALFVGIDDESKAYRVYWPERRRISAERNVIFPPSTEVDANGIMDEGESMATPAQSATSNAVGGSIQNTSPPTAQPLTPPRTTQPLPEPTTP